MPLKTPSQISVSTRRGVITFDTLLTWEEAVIELRKIALEGNEFAISLLEREDKNLYMSESQVSWVYKIAQDNINANTQDDIPQNVDVSNILGSLIEASVSGLKKPALRLVDNEDRKIVVKFMSYGKNAGGCWVNINSELLGKIDDQGKFTPYNNSYVTKEYAMEYMRDLNENLSIRVKEYGRKTGQCACCGRLLTNSLSIAMGIGPICAEKFGYA